LPHRTPRNPDASPCASPALRAAQRAREQHKKKRLHCCLPLRSSITVSFPNSTGQHRRTDGRKSDPTPVGRRASRRCWWELLIPQVGPPFPGAGPIICGRRSHSRPEPWWYVELSQFPSYCTHTVPNPPGFCPSAPCSSKSAVTAGLRNTTAAGWWAGTIP
jgi:hypothetical protein